MKATFLLGAKYARLCQKIEFKLTFKQWLDIWLSSGNWHQRGKSQGCYVMSRINDLGHYEVGNVFIQRQEDNHSETYHPPRNYPPGGIKYYLGKTGKNHPRSKPIETPLGIFESVAQAAKAHGIESMTIQYRLKKYPNLYKRL